MPTHSEKALISAIKELLKKDRVVKKIFFDFNRDIEDIEDVPVSFGKINASAKTKNAKIILNEKLLKDGDFSDDIHYIVHELVHYLQQTSNRHKYYKNDNDDYLDMPAEVEAFRYQIMFIDHFYGPEEADEYLKDLLDFHNFEGDARDKKSKELRG